MAPGSFPVAVHDLKKLQWTVMITLAESAGRILQMSGWRARCGPYRAHKVWIVSWVRRTGIHVVSRQRDIAGGSLLTQMVLAFNGTRVSRNVTIS